MANKISWCWNERICWTIGKNELQSWVLIINHRNELICNTTLSKPIIPLLDSLQILFSGREMRNKNHRRHPLPLTNVFVPTNAVFQDPNFHAELAPLSPLHTFLQNKVDKKNFIFWSYTSSKYNLPWDWSTLPLQTQDLDFLKIYYGSPSFLTILSRLIIHFFHTPLS